MINKLYNYILKIIKENYKFFILIILLCLIMTYKLPWSIYTPGGIINVEERINNSKYQSNGSINLTYVSVLSGTIPSILLSYIIPEWDIVPNDEIEKNGNIEEANIRDTIYMNESISNALYVAYNFSNTDYEITKESGFVTYILDEAITELKVGDEIISYDNIEYTDLESLQTYISSKKEKDVINFKIKRNNKEKNCQTTLINYEDSVKMGISLVKVYDYSNGISYKVKNGEAGPSGGLMLSLAMYNSLTEKDITKGLKICGTGTIDTDGNIGEIGGVKYKIMGAERNKCDVFLTPEENYDEAIEVKNKFKYDLDIIKATTFIDALNILNDL